MSTRIDKTKAIKKWKPIIESLGVTDADRIDWISEMAEYHQIKENVAYVNQGNIAGLGLPTGATPASIPGITTGAAYAANGGTIGSGDVGQNLLPVAMKVAAQTIGLDLVAVKPTPGPKIDLMYIDFKYDDTPQYDMAEYKPQVFKVKVTGGTDAVPAPASIAALDEAVSLERYLRAAMAAVGATETVGGLTKRVFVQLTGAGSTAATTNLTSHDAVTTDKEAKLEFLGFSRVDGLPMFRAFRQVNTATGQPNWSFVDAKNTFSPVDTIAAVFAAGFYTGGSLVAIVNSASAATAYDVTAFSGTVAVELVSALEDHIPGYVSNFVGNNLSPMNRLEDEQNYPGVIAPSVEMKSVGVGTIEVSSALKRTEIEDIKANTGIDIVQKMQSILVNELSQHISKEIVAKIFAMGDENRKAAPGYSTGTTIFDFNVDNYLLVAPGGETSHALQRKLVSKIMNASNFIATEGRVGPAQYAVTNGNLASVLMDISGYTINPTASKLSGNGQLYPVGTIGAVSIYVDPYMKYNDNRIALGRKNNPDQPGIIFVPYLMAQNIEIISEATRAPRIFLRSRYAVTEVGFFPHKQYMTINVTDSNNRLI